VEISAIPWFNCHIISHSVKRDAAKRIWINQLMFDSRLALGRSATFVLTCLAALVTPVEGASLFFRYGGPQAGGHQVWQVLLRPNSASAAAVEIGFQFSGGSILSITPNSAVFDDLNPGQNPFTGSVTQGVSINDYPGPADAAFAALGGVIPTTADTLVLTLVTNHAGVMTLGGQNHNGFFTGARIVQNNVKMDGLTAALQVTGMEADFNSSGKVDGADFLIWQRRLGLGPSASRADGDANADGSVDAADVAIWRGQFGSLLGAAIAVPELLSLHLIALGLSGLIFLARSNRLVVNLR
jgi:hypothetical protein